MRLSIQLLMLFLCAVTLPAQNKTSSVNGRVADKSGSLQGVVVTYKHKGQANPSINEYALTDAEGRFSIPLQSAPVYGDSIKVSMLGYATKIAEVNLRGLTEVLLEEKAIGIKEVVVRAPKVTVSADTVKYNVQSFAEVQDKSIADVLKRMPGVEVAKDGSISYNGEPIGNLYVEGVDVLGGRYTLLSKNMSAKDIKTVEVMENHQPIKALSGYGLKTRPAINLVMQEKSRGKWIGSSNLAAGIASDPSPLWDGNLYLMWVGRKNSSVNNIKTNNTGVDLSKELKVNSLYDRSISVADNFFSIGTSNAPLESERVRFNTTFLVNSSNQWRLKNDRKLTSSVSYLFDRLESWNSSSTTYYFEDSEQTVNEGRQGMDRQHLLQARVESELNKKEHYLRNVFKTEGKVAEAREETNGQYPNTQKADLPYFYISDDVRHIINKGSRAWTIDSKNDFSQFNQNLTVFRQEGAHPYQTVDVMDFNTDTKIYSNAKLSNSATLGFSAGIKASVRSLTSRLEGLEIEATSTSLFKNDQITAYVNPYISPNLNFSSRKLQTWLSATGGWSNYWGLEAGHFKYSSSAQIRYIPVPKILLEASGSVSNRILDINEMYTGYILQNYRYLGVGSINVVPDCYNTLTAHVNYKNPVSMFFLDIFATSSWSIYQTTSTRDFTGNYIILGESLAPSRNIVRYVTVSGSKGVYGINGKIGLTASLRNISTTRVQNGERTPNSRTMFSLTPSFSARLSKWASIEYNFDYLHSKLSLLESGTSESKDNYNQKLSFDFTPVKNFDLKVSAEHYHTSLTASLTKNTVFVDAAIVYRFVNGVELNLSARNLLDQRTYAYSVFNILEQFSCEYGIRPFNLTTGIYFSF